jgi:ATP-dependent DNA helicase DinG
MIGLSEGGGAKPSRLRELANDIFGETGTLCTALKLEHRPEQEQMARTVAGALAGDTPLLFEAGTGVGKSLAYLVPGIIHAVDQARQLIVSTHTISLQEQIQQKDLPLCRRVFREDPAGAPYAEFRSAVLVGKSNYLCPTRLSHALIDKTSLFADADYEELQRIAAWADITQTGLRHELKPPPRPEVWDSVNADSSACSRKHCDCEKCHYQRARARLKNAHVIIVNHALLFALINAGGARNQGGDDARGVLFPDDFLVLDEAHTVPEVATANFGLSLSSYGVDRALKYLFNPKTKRGVLRKQGSAEGERLVIDALDASKQFFDFIATKLLDQRAIVRVREAGVAEPTLDGPLGALHRLLGKLGDRLDPESRASEEIQEQKQRIKGLQAELTEWLTLGDQGHVYWAERSGRKQTIVSLRSAPIDVAPELRRHLFGCSTSVVCTSATLAMGGSIEPFAARIGAERAEAVAVKSPFDYERNMRVYVASDVPLPSPQEARLALDALTDYIRFCTAAVPGGSLVLFTSYTDMRAVAATLEPEWRKEGRPFLLQGAELSRTELADQMRTLGNAVLFGTDSFWTGVDVPGTALSQVIITRLPFDPPTHPITEARCEHIRDAGGNPFNELTLPDALIKFRQGVGRLIRSKTDRGVITILDSRVLAKTYGREFIASLPTTEYERLDRDNRDRAFRPFP